MVQWRKRNGDEVPIPAWLWSAIGATLLALGGWLGVAAKAGFDHHTVEIDLLQSTQVSYGEQIKQHKEQLARIDDKLDRILERLPPRQP